MAKKSGQDGPERLKIHGSWEDAVESAVSGPKKPAPRSGAKRAAKKTKKK